MCIKVEFNTFYLLEDRSSAVYSFSKFFDIKLCTSQLTKSVILSIVSFTYLRLWCKWVLNWYHMWNLRYQGSCTKVAVPRWLHQGRGTNVAVPRWLYAISFFIDETLKHNILLSVNFFIDDFSVGRKSALFVLKWSQFETSGNDLIHIHRSDTRNSNLVVNILSFKYSHRRYVSIIKSYFYHVKVKIKTIGKLRLTFHLLLPQRR